MVAEDHQLAVMQAVALGQAADGLGLAGAAVMHIEPGPAGSVEIVGQVHLDALATQGLDLVEQRLQRRVVGDHEQGDGGVAQLVGQPRGVTQARVTAFLARFYKKPLAFVFHGLVEQPVALRPVRVQEGREAVPLHQRKDGLRQRGLHGVDEFMLARGQVAEVGAVR